MEIRNMTSAGSTSFGMSLLRPDAKNMDRFVTAVGIDKGNFASKVRKRGLKQLQGELKDCKRYDVKYNVNKNDEDVFQVVDNTTGMIVKEYKKGQNRLIQSSLKDNLEKMSDPYAPQLQKLTNAAKFVVKLVKLLVANPKESMPNILLTAARDAKAFEKASAGEAKTRVVHNNAVGYANDIFDK